VSPIEFQIWQTRGMAKEFHELWASIGVDLTRARETLPDVAADHEAIRAYQEYLDHNELELACDNLERYAESHPASQEFWLALRNAATKMELSHRAFRYGQKISNGDTPRSYQSLRFAPVSDRTAYGNLGADSWERFGMFSLQVIQHLFADITAQIE